MNERKRKIRSDAAIRQSFVTDRRRDSGLVTKKFHLTRDKINKLKRISREMGFVNSELNNSENLSSIIELCIDVFIDKSLKGKARNRDALYLNKLYNIIKFKEHEDYDNEDIAIFMQLCPYKTPRLIKDTEQNGIKKLSQDEIWTPELVEKLKDIEYIQSQINALNQHTKNKKPMLRVTRKMNSKV